MVDKDLIIWYIIACGCGKSKHIFMREWLSGGASPCQGEGRGFDPRLALYFFAQKVVPVCLITMKVIW